MKIPTISFLSLFSISFVHGQGLPGVGSSLESQVCESWMSTTDYTMGITCAILELDQGAGVSQSDIRDFLANDLSFEVNPFFLALGKGVQSKKFDIVSGFSYKLNETYASTGIASALANKKTAVNAEAVASTNPGVGSKGSKGGGQTSKGSKSSKSRRLRK